MSSGNAQRTALVIGSARCMLADLGRACSLIDGTFDTYIAVNHAGRDFPGPLPHFATMHPELYPGWIIERRRNGWPDPGAIWTVDRRPVPEGYDFQRVPNLQGSSGLLAVTVLLCRNFSRIVCVGVPLDAKESHYDDAKRKEWRDASRYRAAWVRAKPRLLGRVKSMSGWTRELLGEPTREWLES